MTRKNSAAIEAAERTYANAIADAGNEYRENVALGMPRAEAERIWQESKADARAIRGEALDHIEIEYA